MSAQADFVRDHCRLVLSAQRFLRNCGRCCRPERFMVLAHLLQTTGLRGAFVPFFYRPCVTIIDKTCRSEDKQVSQLSTFGS